jgi:hypothetical protein
MGETGWTGVIWPRQNADAVGFSEYSNELSDSTKGDTFLISSLRRTLV